LSRDDGQRLQDIDKAIRAIKKYAGEGLAAGPVSDVVRDAILFQLVIIGEAVKGLSDAIRERDRDDLLKRFAGLRDILTHEYFRIDIKIVEKVLDERLPLLHELTEELRD